MNIAVQLNGNRIMADDQKQTQPNLLNAVGEVVNAALLPTAQEVGKELAFWARFVCDALAPLHDKVYDWTGLERQFFPEVTANLADVPPDRLIAPKVSLAGPLLEAARFTADEPELRSMFAKLLATAMDADTARDAHPAFVSILRQITSDEARILEHVSSTGNGLFVLTHIHLRNRDGSGYVPMAWNLSLIGEDAGCERPGDAPAYITNLDRLGLIRIASGETATDQSLYEYMQGHPPIGYEFDRIQAEDPDRLAVFVNGVATITPLGERLARACIADTESDEMEAASEDDDAASQP